MQTGKPHAGKMARAPYPISEEIHSGVQMSVGRHPSNPIVRFRLIGNARTQHNPTQTTCRLRFCFCLGCRCKRSNKAVTALLQTKRRPSVNSFFFCSRRTNTCFTNENHHNYKNNQTLDGKKWMIENLVYRTAKGRIDNKNVTK